MIPISQSIGSQPGREPINWCPPGSTKCYSFIRDYVYIAPLPDCAKQNPPCPIVQPAPFVFKAGDRIEGTMGVGMVKTEQGMEIPAALLQTAMPTPYAPVVYVQSPITQQSPISYVSPAKAEIPSTIDYSKIMEEKPQSRDPWTGGIEWDRIFSPNNFWRLVVVMFFIFLFLKYMLPLFRKSFAKS